MNARRAVIAGVIAATMIGNVLLLVHFYDRFWWAPDDGLYAHVASRLADGQVLDRDVEENHPGYVTFVHLATFRLFGQDFVSLRYPLALAAFLQGALVVSLLVRRGLVETALGGLAAVILGVVQFLNPQPHWYCALVALAAAVVLTYLPARSRWRDPLLGFLVAVTFLLRQLTGVFLMAGVLTVLLSEGGEARTNRERLAARALLSFVGVGLAAYQLVTTDVFGLLLFGVWPLLLVGAVAGTTRASNGRVLRLLWGLAVGGAVAALPLFAYHLFQGSLRWWLQDTVVQAVRVVDLPYLKASRYWHFLVGGAAGLSSGPGAGIRVNGLYWCILPLCPAAVGAGVLLRLRSGGKLAPLCAIAVFYGLVALFNQIAIYLYYTAAITVAALLLLGSTQPRWRRTAIAGVTAFVMIVALVFHAGQPISRGRAGILQGMRAPLVPSGLDRCQLLIAPGDRELYRAVTERVMARTDPGDPIFVFPNHAELYFLTKRTNPFRFYNTALGVRGPDEVQAVLRRLAQLRPKAVVHAPGDQYGNGDSAALLAGLKASYHLTDSIGAFDIYEPSERETR